MKNPGASAPLNEAISMVAMYYCHMNRELTHERKSLLKLMVKSTDQVYLYNLLLVNFGFGFAAIYTNKY